MAIFNSYVSLPEGRPQIDPHPERHLDICQTKKMVSPSASRSLGAPVMGMAFLMGNKTIIGRTYGMFYRYFMATMEQFLG